jgi:hypothetical protein
VPTPKDIKSEISGVEHILNQVREDAAEIVKLIQAPGTKANFQTIKELAENIVTNAADARVYLDAATNYCDRCELG